MVQNTRKELSNCPLSLCGNPMKEKVSDKYLGDFIHSSGPSQSVECTISNRYGRTLLGILETRAIIDDCRINTVGGIQSGLDYWEMAYLPSLINNCQTWTKISDSSIKMLEDLQNTMYQILLNVPRTCPKPALCWELGGIQMELRIVMSKLNFVWHLSNLDDKSLAKEIFVVQKEQKLPGLVRECLEWIDVLNLPNVLKERFSKTQWKKKVKEAIKKYNEADLREKMKKSSKLRNSEMIKESCELKPYLTNLTVNDSRHIFKKRTSMTQYVKMNYMNDIKNTRSLWKCDSCQTSIDSMGHVLWCPSYGDLRIGKNMHDDHDMARYLHDVMIIRSKLDLQR